MKLRWEKWNKANNNIFSNTCPEPFDKHSLTSPSSKDKFFAWNFNFFQNLIYIIVLSILVNFSHNIFFYKLLLLLLLVIINWRTRIDAGSGSYVLGGFLQILECLDFKNIWRIPGNQSKLIIRNLWANSDHENSHSLIVNWFCCNIEVKCIWVTRLTTICHNNYNFREARSAEKNLPRSKFVSCLSIYICISDHSFFMA